MSPQGVGAPNNVVPVAPTAAQARIIIAALDLFARHGVGGTSLQMIADEIGVTKAAVYHQFNTKDEIVLTAAEAELARLQAVIRAAEGEPSPTQAREALVRGIVDLAVERRHTVSIIMSDPVIVGFFAEHASFRDALDRVCRLLMGNTKRESRVSAAMLTAAISGAVLHPLVTGLDDATLRSELLQLTGRFLRPGP
jgi:AcrR family transcriptional regulator